MEKCPRCNGFALEVAPAEPDVGILVPLLACKRDGQFFFIHHNNEWCFLDDKDYVA